MVALKSETYARIKCTISGAEISFRNGVIIIEVLAQTLKVLSWGPQTNPPEAPGLYPYNIFSVKYSRKPQA